jgi:SAM-dependent methyltransferase
MSEVIEHLDDLTLAATMDELRRVLKPGGYFMGTSPDNEDVVAKTMTCPRCGERFHRVGHVRSFTRQSLSKFLQSYFDVQECYTFRGMALNWRGVLMYWYQSLPYRIIALMKPSVTVPQSMGQTLFFLARHVRR